MPNAWIACPSCNPTQAEQTAERWKAQGYRTAFLLNGDAATLQVKADLIIRGDYPGFPASINRLCEAIVTADTDAGAIVAIGDDTLPDPHRTATDILTSFISRFPDLYGVMQPTGDAWGDYHSLTSPWLGRTYCDRHAPMCGDYHHYFADEELRHVAESRGVLWFNPDVRQEHQHWSRLGRPRPRYLPATPMWVADKAVYDRRRAQGWPASVAADGL